VLRDWYIKDSKTPGYVMMVNSAQSRPNRATQRSPHPWEGANEFGHGWFGERLLPH